MKLYHKEQLVKHATKYIGSAFWEDVLVKYAKDLGCEEDDYYGCLFYLGVLKDSDYCGMGLNDRANFYLYSKERGELYWFYLASDAAAWVNVENGYVLEYLPKPLEPGYSFQAFFKEYRRQQKNNFYWLLPADIGQLEDIVNQPPLIYCLDNGMSFPNTTSAARWLFNSGFAKTIHSAKASLDRHLAGLTATCYKMKFEMR